MLYLSKLLVQTVILATVLMSPFAHSQAPAASFAPEQVFSGRSEGRGELRLGLGKLRPFTVESLGSAQAEGRFRLDQHIRFDGETVKSRAWVFWQTSPGQYSATLTDAAGPVVGRTQGRRMTLRYPLKPWGLVMHQTLDLTSNGQTVINSGSIRLLGLPVGRLQETIQLKPYQPRQGDQ